MKQNMLLFFFFILNNFVLLAQAEKNVAHQSLIWTRYYNQLKLNTRCSIHSEFDNRVFTCPIIQNLFAIRVQGRYKISEQVELGSGVAYFNVATQDPDIGSKFNRPEYRLQHDITWALTFGKINLNQRCQIEERFFQNFDIDGLTSGATFFWRFRYRIQGDYTFWKKEKQFLKAIIANEIMFNAGSNIVKNTFDQNRIYAGLQYGFNPNLALEIGYMNSFQQRAAGVDYFDRNIIRLSVFHKMKL